MSKLLVVGMLAVGAIGCVTEVSDDGAKQIRVDWADASHGDGVCDANASAAEYYAQFAYGAVDDWYRVALTWQVTAKLDNGDTVDMDLHLLPENRVIIEYGELRPIDATKSEVNNEAVIITRAEIDEATRKIHIVGVGTGTPINLSGGGAHCAPGIDFTHEADFGEPGLTGDKALFVRGLSSRFVIDPDNLDDVPSARARRWFEEDVASGKIRVIHIR